MSTSRSRDDFLILLALALVLAEEEEEDDDEDDEEEEDDDEEEEEEDDDSDDECVADKVKTTKKKIETTQKAEETQRAAAGNPQQLADPPQVAPFEVVEIAGPIIKEEILEFEDHSGDIIKKETSQDGVQPGGSFETVYCRSDQRMEYKDYGEPSSSAPPLDPDPVFPEVLLRIKEEPLDISEEPQLEAREEVPQKWRCPLVSCPEMMSSEEEMLRHYNLSHAAKGLGPHGKVPNWKSVAVPSLRTPVVTSGLVSFSSAVSSSSGPVVVTTTFTTTSTPIVSTSVSSSTVHSSVPKLPTIPAVPSPSVSNVQSAASCEASSTKIPTTVPSDDSTILSGETETSNLTDPLDSPPRKKRATLPTSSSTLHSDQNTTNRKTMIVLPLKKLNEVEKSVEQITAEIFQPTNRMIEPGELPLCATDDSEMFSISLARFAQDQRIPIKKKMINIVDCVKQMNISADNIFIAYDAHSKSRSI